MKKIYIILITAFYIAILTNLSFAQTPSWQWARSAGGSGSDWAGRIATDNIGNIYCTGDYTSQTLTFGSTNLVNNSTNGNADIFLVKYDGSGAVIWAKSFGASNWESGNSVATDSSGSVYLCGIFRSATLNLGSVTLTNTTSGYSDVFVAKFDSSGVLQWAKSGGGSNSESTSGIAVDGNRNVYVSGIYLSGTCIFGNDTINNSALSFYDIFLVSYDSLGNLRWIDSEGGNKNDMVQCISIDAQANIYIGGTTYSNSFMFGSHLFGDAVNADLFIAKYDSAGNVIWAHTESGSGYESIYGIEAQMNRCIYLTGTFTDSIHFGTSALTTAGGADSFIAKYDTSGNPIWSQRFGGTADDNAYNVATALSTIGKLYISGEFYSSTMQVGTTTLLNGNSAARDFFIAEFDTSGNPLWGKSSGGSLHDSGASLALDLNGNVYVSGSFQSPTILFDTFTLTCIASNDIFIAKLGTTLTEIQTANNNLESTIFPNPSSGKFRINVGRVSSIMGTIEIYNLVGEKVFQSKINQINNSEIDL